MRVIIAGSRSITDYEVVKKAIEKSGFKIDEVVCGCDEGVDALGETWANANKVKVIRFPAQWKTYGVAAGAVRNTKMAEYAQALIAVHDGVSKGTAHMIREAKRKGLKVFVANP